MNISFLHFKDSKYKTLRFIASTCKPKVPSAGGSTSSQWVFVLPIPNYLLIKTNLKNFVIGRLEKLRKN